jgi:FkbM family methyltransferase
LRRRNFLIELEPGLFIFPELDDYMVHWCFVGDHEKDAGFQFSLSLIRPGNVVIDVGANIGLWSMGAARRVGTTGEVHAFEPVPDNMRRLSEHLRLNGIAQVTRQQRALADTAGQATFYTPTNGNSGAGGLAARAGVEAAIEVPVVTLDEYCAERRLHRVDVLKVDVEGGETLVFRGATQLLASPAAPIIFFETSDSVSSLFQSSSKQVKTLLHEHGYSIYRLESRRLRMIRLDEPHVHEDLFAFKPHHFDIHPQLQRMSG